MCVGKDLIYSHVPVNDMWVSFKSEVLSAIERFIPSKMTKTKYSLPWIDSSIKRLIRKRDKLFFPFLVTLNFNIIYKAQILDINT